MSYNFTLPDLDASTPAPTQGTSWKTITLSLPGDTLLGVPAGRWERRDGRIVATYSRAELQAAVALALEQRRHDLETRLERGLEVLAEATGCQDDEAGRLLMHWDALNAEYDQVVERSYTTDRAYSATASPHGRVLYVTFGDVICLTG